MKKLIAVSFSAVLLLNFGCSSTESLESNGASAVYDRADEAPAPAESTYRAAPAKMPMRPMPRPEREPAPGMGKNNFQTPAGHQMAFTAWLRLNVSDVRMAVAQARELALKLGGYVKRLDDNSATLAIPTPKADQALAELGKSGVVVSFRIEGEDVTRQVTDIAVRLDNLEKSRKRLLALLEKAGKVDEMIKVETALTRVTTEIERIQAQQKNLRGRIDYVTMYVTYSATVQRQVRHNATPIDWINRLGENLLVFNQNISYDKDSFIFGLTLPAGFVKNGAYAAVSGNNCVIELENKSGAIVATHWYGDDYAGIDFYLPLIEKALKERFKLPVAAVRCKIDGCDAAVYTVTPEIGKTVYTYRVAVAVVKSEVKVIVARGEKKNFDAVLSDAAWKKLLDSVNF